MIEDRERLMRNERITGVFFVSRWRGIRWNLERPRGK